MRHRTRYGGGEFALFALLVLFHLIIFMLKSSV